MPGPTTATIKRLFAVSGNCCAFPDCILPLVIGEVVTGEICHIKAQSPDGPRYDPDQSDRERHGFNNLVLMCGDHHKVIDADAETYTVEELLRIKAEHEARHAHGSELSDDIARQFLIQLGIQVAGDLVHIGDKVGTKITYRTTVEPAKAPSPALLHDYCQSLLDDPDLAPYAERLFIYRRVRWLRHPQPGMLPHGPLPPAIPDEPVDLEALLETIWDDTSKCIVLVGEPGIGKSSVLRGLMIAYARHWLEEAASSRFLPILIPLALHSPTEIPVPAFRAALNQTDVLRLLPDEVERLLDNSPCLVLFDSLDEAPPDRRRDMAVVLQNVMRTYPQHRYVVACRSSVYSSNWELGPTLELLELEEPEMQAYAYHRLGRLLGRHFASQLTGHLAQLARNPLALEMMVGLTQSNLAPRSLTDLAAAFSAYLLERRPNAQIEPRARERGLARLAYEMHRASATYLDEARVRDVLLAQAKLWHESCGWRELLNELLDDGLLRAAGNRDRFSFRHHAWQAYFCARYLIRENAQHLAWASMASDPWWQDVLIFAVGLTEDASPIIRSLLKTDVHTILRCMAEAHAVDEATRRAALDSGYSALASAATASERARTAYLLGASGIPDVSDLLEIAAGSDRFVYRALLRGLAMRPMSSKACRALIGQLQHPDWRVRVNAAQAIVANSQEDVDILVDAWVYAKHSPPPTPTGHTTAWLTDYLGEEVTGIYDRLEPSDILARAMVEAGDRVVERLLSYLNTAPPKISEQVPELLVGIGTPRAAFGLLAAASDSRSSSHLCRFIDRILVNRSGPGWQRPDTLPAASCARLERLAISSRDGDDRTRAYALRLLVACCCYNEEMVSRTLGHREIGLHSCVLAIIRDEPALSRSVLVSLLASEDPEIRLAAAERLAGMGYDGEEALWTALSNDIVQPQALTVLSHLIEKELKPLDRVVLRPESVSASTLRLLQDLVVFAGNWPSDHDVIAIDEHLGEPETLLYPCLKQLIQTYRKGTLSLAALAGALHRLAKARIRGLISALASPVATERDRAHEILVSVGNQVVEALVEALDEGRDLTRVEPIIQLLGQLKAVDAIRPIVRWLCRGSLTASTVLARNFGDAAVPFLRETLPNCGDPSPILDTCKAIGTLAACRALVDALCIRDTGLRKYAQHLLLTGWSETATAALDEVLGTLEDREALIWVIATLACLGSPSSLKAVMRYLGSPDAQDQQEAESAVAPLPKAMIPDLVNLLQETNSLHERLGTVRAAGVLGNVPGIADLLLAGLTDPSDTVAVEAKNIWTRVIPTEDTLRLLLPCIRNWPPDKAAVAIRLLGDSRATGCLPILVDMLDCPDKRVGDALLYAFRSMPPQALSPVGESLCDLGPIGQERILAILEGAPKSEVGYWFVWLQVNARRDWLRKRAGDALSKLGTEAVPGLRKCLVVSEDARVQSVAVEALCRIGGSEAAGGLVGAFIKGDARLRTLARRALVDNFGAEAIAALQTAYQFADDSRKTDIEHLESEIVRSLGSDPPQCG